MLDGRPGRFSEQRNSHSPDAGASADVEDVPGILDRCHEQPIFEREDHKMVSSADQLRLLQGVEMSIHDGLMIILLLVIWLPIFSLACSRLFGSSEAGMLIASVRYA